MASLKLILLQDHEELGFAGDEINVAPGYARNYLIPRKIATVVSAGTLRQLESKKEKIEAQRKADLESAQTLSAKLAEITVVIPVQASDDNRLFGSVSERMISEYLHAQGSVKIEAARIRLDEHIKALGEFTAKAKLHKDVIASFKVSVVRS